MKRCGLALTAERVPPPVLVIGTSPLLVALKLAWEFKIFGPKGTWPNNRTSWAAEVSKWMTAFQGQPPERLEYINYGQTMADLLAFYSVIFANLGDIMGQSDRTAALHNYNYLRKHLTAVGTPVAEKTPIYGVDELAK